MDNRFKTIIPFLLLVVLLAAGCVNQSPDTSGCVVETDGTLEITFYSQSRCQTAPSYPGEVSGMFVGVFDSDNILRAVRNLASADIDAAYTETFTLPEGLYSAVAWTGLDDEYFDTETLQAGSTTKSDLFLSVVRDGDTAESLQGAVLLQGESPAFYIAADSSVNTSVNLQEVTNRLLVSVSGLPAGPERYSVTIEAGNGAMNADGTITQDDVLVFLPGMTDGDPGSVVSEFTLLKLETGHTYEIVITDTANDIELYRGSLLGTLILKNPEVDLLCDHDFVIEFTAEDQCECGTYMITEIWVNDWLVHSYSTEF